MLVNAVRRANKDNGLAQHALFSNNATEPPATKRKQMSAVFMCVSGCVCVCAGVECAHSNGVQNTRALCPKMNCLTLNLMDGLMCSLLRVPSIQVDNSNTFNV